MEKYQMDEEFSMYIVFNKEQMERLKPAEVEI